MEAAQMRYRRDYVAGGTYFFTVVTWRRRRAFATEAAVASLRAACRQTQKRHPFAIPAAVVLPDHLHCVWTLPDGDSDFSMRWRLIKGLCGRELRDRMDDGFSGGPLWQKRFWEHRIRDARDLGHHLDYIHYNPVKHGYVARPGDWPYSSFRRYVSLGHYSPDWGQAPVDWADAGRE